MARHVYLKLQARFDRVRTLARILDVDTEGVEQDSVADGIHACNVGDVIDAAARMCTDDGGVAEALCLEPAGYGSYADVRAHYKTQLMRAYFTLAFVVM